MIEVSITIFPKSDKIEDVKALILKQRKYTINHHKGCFEFLESKSIIDDRTFYINEKWHTTRELVNYRNSNAFLEYNKTIKTLLDYDPIIHSFEHM